MKQLLILSGKGGTGKTTIASAFIKLSGARAYADCDVDAPNLRLVMTQAVQPLTSDYYGMPKAEIDTGLCIACGLCSDNCRYDAISAVNGYKVDPFACEGCGVCVAVCPAEAVSLKAAIAGELMLYEDGHQVFSTAQLKTGSGTSGMLVTEVKKQMKANTKEDVQFAVIDGSPGIGCPVIASLSGVDMVLIVAEPSISGTSDMERIIITAEQFQTKVAVCINKHDTNPANSTKIEAYCKTRKLPFVGSIPFDSQAVKAINQGLTVVDIDCASGSAVKEVYRKALQLLLSESEGPAA